MIDATAAGSRSGALFGVAGEDRGCDDKGAALSHAASPQCSNTPKAAEPCASVPFRAQSRSFS